MINTYNLPMINLSAAAKATVIWPSASNGYTQISYDKSTGNKSSPVTMLATAGHNMMTPK